MPTGDPGKEQFRRAIVTMRNLHIAAGVYPLILLRQELLGNDELQDRGGTDDPTKLHLSELLLHCDRWRRRITHNPDNEELGDLIEKAIKVAGAKGDDRKSFKDTENPFGGDDIQNASGGLIDLPYDLSGGDVDIPLNSDVVLKSGHAILLLGAIDRCIVSWTRLNSRNRTRFITRFDSMRIYGHYQEILGYLNSFTGDDNRNDVAQVLPSEEPLGPTDSPNMRAETSGR